MHSDIDLKKVDKCIGDPDADVENPVLKAEQESQVCLLNLGVLKLSIPFCDVHEMSLFQIGKGSRGDVTILPTLVVNNRQYRGIREQLTCQSYLFFCSISRFLC